MNLEGDLTVTLAHDGRQVRRVDVKSTRPQVAARLLTGKPAVEAATTIPLLFAVCGGAQGAAAASALSAAGAAGFAGDTAARVAGIVVESLQEGFWHLLIGWPNAMASQPNVTPVTAARYLIATSARTPDGTDLLGDAAAMRALAEGLRQIARKAIFGRDPAAFLDLTDVGALEAWAAVTDTLPARLLRHVIADTSAPTGDGVALMPVPDGAWLAATIAPALAGQAGFAQAPTLDGAPVETGALARMHAHPLVAACAQRYGHGAVTRLVARLAEIPAALDELAGAGHGAGTRVQGVALGPGNGLAAVETARGLLLHRAGVHDECVIDYQIVAPTEWNFHPQGALVRALTGMPANDESALLRHARLAVHTLDPCVACRVQVAHA
ncbi:MAG: nickel-dependent hydrogenase large subunit [Burkholderiales bacterium]